MLHVVKKYTCIHSLFFLFALLVYARYSYLRHLAHDNIIFENILSFALTILYGMLLHALGGAIILFSLQHSITPTLDYCLEGKPEVLGVQQVK